MNLFQKRASLAKRNPAFPGSSKMQTIYRIRGKVSCPRCKRGVGMDCRTPSGKRVRRMHDARVLAGLVARKRRGKRPTPPRAFDAFYDAPPYFY